MRAYIDVTGKNQEDATKKALAQLGLDRDDVSVEVLEREKSGFLGFGSSPAKVRVYYGPEEEEPKPAPIPTPAREPEKKAEPAAKQPERPAAEEEREKEKKPQPEKKPDRKPDRPKKDRQPEKQPEKKRPAPQEKKEPAPVEEQPAPVQDLGEEVDDEKAQAIKTFLTGLLEHMECPAEVLVYLPEKGRYKVILKGQGLGALIGRRGETLDAIQQLTSYAVNRTGVRVRVQLDAENYREKREQSLRHLARKVAGKVVRYRRSVTLEPMNAYERHVIHTALQDFPGVSTHSTGTDPNRRVVVTFDREKQ